MTPLASRIALAVLFVVTAVLVFANLGDRYLWDDEAENALLAERILTYGIPVARDGVNVISQGCGYDADENYLWTYHGWLPMYLAAASLKLLGPSTLAARLPFALLGFLSVVSLYTVARRLFDDRLVAFLAGTFLALSVPFLLHARQSRYYAIAAFAAIWMLHFYVGLLERRRGALLGFLVASTAMFHSLHAMWAASVVGLAAGSLALPIGWRNRLRPLVGVAATLVANVTWVLLYGNGWLVAFSYRRHETLVERVTGTFSRFVTYVWRADVYVLPAVLVVAFGAWLLWKGRDAARSRDFRTAAFLLVSALVFLGCVAVLPFTFFRYMLNVLPALAMLEAYMLRTMCARRPLALGALVVVLVATDVLHGWSMFAPVKLSFTRASVASPLGSYLGELRGDFVGPMKAVIRRLERERAAPGQTIFVSYGDLPLRFYTRLRVYGGQTCEPLPPRAPDWVVVRYFLRFDNSAPGSKEDMVRMLDYVRHGIPWQRYERIDLLPEDVRWDNIPEPMFHVFTQPPGPGHPLALWKRDQRLTPSAR